METIIYDLGTMKDENGIYIELLTYDESIELVRKTTFEYIPLDEFIKYLDSLGKYSISMYEKDDETFRMTSEKYESLLECGYYCFDDIHNIVESFEGTKYFKDLCNAFQQ